VSHNLVALRLSRTPEGPSVLDRLRDVMDANQVVTPDDCRRIAKDMNLPEAQVFGVASYYRDLSFAPRGRRRVHACVGTACVAARGDAHLHELARALGVAPGETRDDGEVSLEPTYCLGFCNDAPAAMVAETVDGHPHKTLWTRLDAGRAARLASFATTTPDARGEVPPRIASFVTPTVVLRNLVEGRDATTFAKARALGVWDAFLAHRHQGPAVLDAVMQSGLRGRGGAGFSTGQKWRFAAQQPPGQKYVVCNADEGDPGSYIDKWLLELDPHSVLEGMALAGIAIGASRGKIYVRSEYPAALHALHTAVREARDGGVLGDTHPTLSFDVDVVEGAGSYVCGEETALLRSIEGLRGMVTARPPFPAVKGLFERPTVVNNVETLISVPWIVTHGADAYAAVGVGKSRGTKAVCLNERFVSPGLYEVPLGITLRAICEDLGGGMRDGRSLKALQIGGPLGGILPASALDTPLGFEELDAVGGLLGHGGIVAFDDRTDMRALALHLFTFGDEESCGKCFPCRLGMRRGRELVQGLVEGAQPYGDPLAMLTSLCETMQHGSLCAHGGGLPAPIRSIVTHWPEELLAPPAPTVEAAHGDAE
jgi:NADH-quinone oxidoreductase subunit F